jgi:adenylate cyclase
MAAQERTTSLPVLRELRGAFAWIDARRSYAPGIAALRQMLPGDPRFGDPLSTAGTEPAQVVARRARNAGSGRWSALSELGFAVLQVADWLSPQNGESRPLAILFTDLAGFSSWALHAGDEQSLDFLRSVDASVTASVERHAGSVVKRLGDGSMAVFPGVAQAVNAAAEATQSTKRIEEGEHRVGLRAGVHLGNPHGIGGDFIGVDVNVAARLCEAAPLGQVLVSGAVREQLSDARFLISSDSGEKLDGVPAELEIFALR